MTATSPTPARAGPLQRTFRSLRVYNYRLFFFSQVISMSGTWMQSVAQNWLVLSLTGSAVDLGITVGLQFGPVLVFGAWGGSLADRVDKRKLLMGTQAAAATLALVLGVLAATGVVEVWMIWVLAGLTGTAMALGIASQQSFLYEMVGPDDVANAVGLNSVVINSSRIIGPAVGAVLIASAGVAPCFFINAASFLAVIGALAIMRVGDLRRGKPLAREPGQVRAGLKYAWRTPALRVPLLMLLIISILAYNYSVVLPLLTKSVFGRGGGSYGVLSAAMGVGALCRRAAHGQQGRAPHAACSWAPPSPSASSPSALAFTPGYYVGLGSSSSWAAPACSSSARPTPCCSSTRRMRCAAGSWPCGRSSSLEVRRSAARSPASRARLRRPLGDRRRRRRRAGHGHRRRAGAAPSRRGRGGLVRGAGLPAGRTGGRRRPGRGGGGGRRGSAAGRRPDAAAPAPAAGRR